MPSVKNLLFLAVAATGSVIKRDAAQITNGLRLINKDILTLKVAVNSYSGGVSGAIPILGAQQTLTGDVKSTTDEVNNTPSVSEAESDAIFTYIKDQLAVSLQSFIKALESKKSIFDHDHLTSAVVAAVKSSQESTEHLSNALMAKAPGSFAARAKALKDEIDHQFEDAIAYFS
ncbi:4MeS [Metarhizium album ARSEF 1941]|uniref:4MeS n=1 Tax=Metarhizium album (strain ARSEF 1941) TaxID=1081103 RepID=A0A0B2WW75_METAS|nr:4MeS [Metarhizium album ARSEF 1941]KHO00447.1 4MeS [Metarhizium album ARSEF 1941]